MQSAEGYLLALWRHECERVFADKMTNPADKTWVTDAIMTLAAEAYGRELTAQIQEPLYFVDFLREAAVDAEGNAAAERPKKYEAVRDLATLKERVEALQRKFNEENKVNATAARIVGNAPPISMHLRVRHKSLTAFVSPSDL